MPLKQLVQEIEHLYAPALALRRVFTRETRQRIQQNVLVAAVFVLFAAVLSMAVGRYEFGDLQALNILATLGPKLWGAFLVLFAIGFAFSALEAMHRSYYFFGLRNILEEADEPDHVPVSFEVATIVDDTNIHDLTAGFLDSVHGQEILFRAGVTEEAYAAYVGARSFAIDPATFVIEREGGVVLATYVRSIYKYDKEFAQFLEDNNTSEHNLLEAARTVTWIEREERRAARWWSRDNLGRIPGLGKEWSYGQTYFLDKYGHDLVEDQIWFSAVMGQHSEQDEVEEIEQILARNRQSNALVVGSDMMTVRKRVAQLYHKIREGQSLPTLEAKHVYFIDFGLVQSMHADKADFENEVRLIMNQAVAAGNIIVYIEYFASAMQSAGVSGVDLVDVLLPYFDAADVQIIAAATHDAFYGTLQRDSRVTQMFDVVQMHDINTEAMVELLRQRALAIERRTRVVFTVPALEAVAVLADQYFPQGEMPDKAYDLLEELVPMAQSLGTEQLLKHHVEDLVTEKSGVPVGDPTQEERDKLLTLEDAMHERVVGQARAVSAVAKALRRSRSGVAGGDRPMGSFLFLGPTGVGKTETAKALAEVLFGDEHMMMRLDMSEFQGDDALERLTGEPSTGKAGRLSTMLREKQYGVLLLDEFEKSASAVHDLFLQVLDEGHFTDATGKGVNVRNVIVIATSNAGADLIWEWEKQNKDLSAMKRSLIDVLIERGAYRPEFLNRFDDILLFHPLTEEQVQTIARLHLNKFAKRIHKQHGITLEITDELVERIARAGYDPQFGGRPLRRAIKEEVEQVLADSMLTGDLKPGQTISYRMGDGRFG